MRVPVPEEILPAEQLGGVHFIGVGGAGLSAIARVMAQRGLAVTGSDDHDTPFLPALREVGVTCHGWYAADHLGGAETVVVTTAAREDNPEVLEATRLGLRLWPRSAGLQSVLAGRRVLAVAGTHGKTTTTSLLTVALIEAGAAPSYTVGGVLAATGRNADHGTGELFVAEADESDGAFLVYRPEVALVTNVGVDHLDQWGTAGAYVAAFEEFAGHVAAEGFLVCCIDDPGAARLAEHRAAAGAAVVRVGEHPDADVRAVDVELVGTTSSFTVVDAGLELGRVRLAIPGRHYVVDALGALTVGLRLGFAFDDLRRGLEAFTGTQRRMEAKGEAAGVRVYDSYAHQPLEIAADLEAARAVAGEGRVVVLFQPHLVSRTRLFGAAMGVALGAADDVVVLEVYRAREDADPAVTGAGVAAAVPLPPDRVVFEPDHERAAARVAAAASAGDLVLTLGAGDVTALGPRVLDLLASRAGAGGTAR